MGSMSSANTAPNRLLCRSLFEKIRILSAEAAGCSNPVAYACVMESVADARRQLRDALGGGK
jgi:hypothetical protein